MVCDTRIHRAAALLLAGALLWTARPVLADDKADAPAAKPAALGPDYQKKIAGWQKERDQGLRSDNSWLTVAGLFWLDEGENQIGSDPRNKVILPEGKAPAVAATLIRHGNKVQIKAPEGSGITADDLPLPSELLTLRSDAEGGEKGPTMLHLGPLTFFIIQRGDKVGVRVKDSKSAALSTFKGLEYFPVQTSWHVEARFEPANPPRKIAIANILGQVAQEDSPGTVVFDWQGKTYRLDALKGDDSGGLFVIFADQTNGKETYGAGRFLDTDPPKDGKVVIDFNTAYNPPCAFTPFATCPLPPAQNRLALRVDAGEKKYGDGHPH